MIKNNKSEYFNIFRNICLLTNKYKIIQILQVIFCLKGKIVNNALKITTKSKIYNSEGKKKIETNITMRYYETKINHYRRKDL